MIKYSIMILQIRFQIMKMDKEIKLEVKVKVKRDPNQMPRKIKIILKVKLMILCLMPNNLFNNNLNPFKNYLIYTK